jgi:hypothetical protein
MAKYSVIIPCTLSVQVIVDAENKEDALAKAFDVDFYVDKVAGAELCDFRAHGQIVKGNVFYGVQNEVEVCLIEEEEG